MLRSKIGDPIEHLAGVLTARAVQSQDNAGIDGLAGAMEPKPRSLFHVLELRLDSFLQKLLGSLRRLHISLGVCSSSPVEVIHLEAGHIGEHFIRNALDRWRRSDMDGNLLGLASELAMSLQQSAQDSGVFASSQPVQHVGLRFLGVEAVWALCNFFFAIRLEACLVQSSEKLALVAMVFAKCCEADLKMGTAVV